jgi:hypothetical protein
LGPVLNLELSPNHEYPTQFLRRPCNIHDSSPQVSPLSFASSPSPFQKPNLTHCNQRLLNLRPHPPRLPRRLLRTLQQHLHNLPPEHHPAPRLLATARNKLPHNARTSLRPQRHGRLCDWCVYQCIYALCRGTRSRRESWDKVWDVSVCYWTWVRLSISRIWKRYLTVISGLTSLPIQGTLIPQDQGSFSHLILFSGICVLGGSMIICLARMLRVGFKLRG